MILFRLLSLLFFTIPFVTACSSAPGQDRHSSIINLSPTQKMSAVKKGQKKPLIVIDAGHGGFDFGAQSHAGDEKELALATAMLLKKNLSKMGYPVLMTRSRDIFIPLKQRVKIANDAKSALFVSIHYNAARNHSAEGIEIYYHDAGKHPRTRLSKKLAQNIMSSILSKTGAPSRGVKQGNFLVIRETNMPAILIEGGFITNEKEGKKLSDEQYIEKIAHAISEGIVKYFK